MEGAEAQKSALKLLTILEKDKVDPVNKIRRSKHKIKEIKTNRLQIKFIQNYVTENRCSVIYCTLHLLLHHNHYTTLPLNGASHSSRS